jgi:hypothetical protein
MILIFDLESGTQKKEAQSISFAKMDETEFNKLYSDVLNVIAYGSFNVANTYTIAQTDALLQNLTTSIVMDQY